MPYREIFSRGVRPDTMPQLVDALVVLLTKLHLAGFFWGDCSLSNTLFRRSAGEFAAYLVDAETGELHDQLSDGQRGYDLDIAMTNCFAEMLDLQAGGFMDEEIDPLEIVEGLERPLRRACGRELTGVEDFTTDEMWRIEMRIAAAQRPRLRRRRARHRDRLGRRDGADPAQGRRRRATTTGGCRA